MGWRLVFAMLNFGFAGINIWAAIALSSPAINFGAATFCFGMGIYVTITGGE